MKNECKGCKCLTSILVMVLGFLIGVIIGRGLELDFGCCDEDDGDEDMKF